MLCPLPSPQPLRRRRPAPAAPLQHSAALTSLSRRADSWEAPRAELAPLRALRALWQPAELAGVPAAAAPTLLRRRVEPGAVPSVPTELRRAACMPAT